LWYCDSSMRFHELMDDLSHAWRTLRRSPGASTVAVVILALAIGVNVAFFTFLDAYALSPLPIAAADRYVDVLETDDRGERWSRFTRDEMAALAEVVAPAFEGLYASTFFELPLLEPGRRIVHGQAVSARYFPLLGARFALGGPFDADGNALSGEAAVAVLSDPGWKRLLQADPAALGRRIRLGDTWLTVVGVTTPEFRGVETTIPELWIPLSVHAALSARPGETPRYSVAGLLREGMTSARAAVLGGGVAAGFAPARKPEGRARRLLVEHRRSFLHADERGSLSVIGALVVGAFGLVLLIACANLASLHLARASARHREIATRLALGASRVRLVRQLLAESLLLAGIGAGLGCAVALAGAQMIQARLFSIVTEAGLTLAPIEVRGQVLAFAAFLGVVAGLAFGLLPALEATTPDLVSASRRDGLAFAGRIRPQRLGGLLVRAQVAASLVLLVLASLLLRSALAAGRLEPGYDAAHLVDLRFPRPTAGTLARLRSDPRVIAASAAGHTPLSGQLRRHSMLVDGVARALRYNHVDDAYFETLGLRLAAGRGFRPEEAAGAAPVVVVSAATARALWPDASPLGRVIEVTERGGPAPGRYEVIGMAPDVVSGLFIEGRDPSAVYFAAAAGSRQATGILVRPRDGTMAGIEALRDLCTEIDRAVLCEPKTLKDLAALQRFPFLAASVVASALGSLAIALTSIGLYGLVAFAVVQRLREVGVRLALGATPAAVLRLLVGRAARSILVGLALGLPVCLVLCRLAARYFKLAAFEPATLVGVPLMLAAVGLTAAWIAARPAMAVDPAVTLRAD
jgi:predicted permease